MSLLQEVNDCRRQNLVSEACRRSSTHKHHIQTPAAHLCSCPLSVHNSMETLDRKFDRMLSLQVLDKSKAIAQILQEVRCWVPTDPLWCSRWSQISGAVCRRRCRKQPSRSYSCRKTLSTDTSGTRSDTRHCTASSTARHIIFVFIFYSSFLTISFTHLNNVSLRQLLKQVDQSRVRVYVSCGQNLIGP